MFTTVLYFIPCIISLIWFVLLLFRKKDRQQTILTWLMGFATLHYLSTATFVSPNTDFTWVCRMDIVCQPLILSIIALCIIYIRSHLEKKMSLANIQVFFIPSIIQAAVIWLLYFMIGFDNVVNFTRTANEIGGTLELHGQKLFDALPPEYNTQLYFIFHKFDIAVSNIWCALLAICLIVSCIQVSRQYGYKFGDIFRFWFKGAKTTSERAISFWMMIIVIGECPFVFVGRKFIYHHPALGCAMATIVSLGIFFMCYCEFIKHMQQFTLYRFTHVDISTGNQDEVKQAEENSSGNIPQEAVKADEPAVNGISTAAAGSRIEEKNNNIASEMRRLLEEEKIYTDKNLTLEILAKRLNTNRNKLSTIVNHVYGEDFRNVLAGLRIEEAKRFMKANPTATSESVAMHCGFKDTSTFFHRFKAIVGESPRVWIAK